MQIKIEKWCSHLRNKIDLSVLTYLLKAIIPFKMHMCTKHTHSHTYKNKIF